MYRGLLQIMQQTLFSAVVLVLVLIILALLVVLIILVLVLLILLVIHDSILRNVVLRIDRSVILSRNSGFILCLKNQTADQTADNSGGYSTCGGLQSPGEDAKEAFFLHRFPDTFGKGMPKADKGNGCARSGEFNDWLIESEAAEQYADHHIADQDPCRGQFGFVNENLSDEAENTAHQKRFQIIHISFFLLEWIRRGIHREREVPAVWKWETIAPRYRRKGCVSTCRPEADSVNVRKG